MNVADDCEPQGSKESAEAQVASIFREPIRICVVHPFVYAVEVCVLGADITPMELVERQIAEAERLLDDLRRRRHALTERK